MNVNWTTLFKGAYITAVELDGKTVTLTVSDVTKELVADPESGEEREKGIVHFKETDRGWVLNRTNGSCLAAMFGDMTGGWLGKRVTLYATPVQVGPKRELGIRVKGSPDIREPVPVTIKLPRRKPISVTMQPTGSAPGPAKAPPRYAESEPEPDPSQYREPGED